VRFEAMSVSDVNDSFGVFDYILVHGVYSWVPAEVQQALLRVCSRNLAPNGLAYVSYNTYPGWHFRGGVREMLLRHDQPSLPPATRIARAREFVAFLSKAAAPFDEAYAGALQFEAETLALATDTYVFHEEFEDVNQPLYFEQFAREAAAAGLQYVAEAQPTAKDAELTSEVDRQIESWTDDRIAKEQYLDFVRNRSFRRSILCRVGLQISAEPLTAAIPAMFVSCLCYPAPAADGSGAEVSHARWLDCHDESSTVRAMFHVLADVGRVCRFRRVARGRQRSLVRARRSGMCRRYLGRGHPPRRDGPNAGSSSPSPERRHGSAGATGSQRIRESPGDS
jgi:SAM-dependent methyltransferase